ncbi:MAG: ATP-binding protein [Sphingomonadales bacterium]
MSEAATQESQRRDMSIERSAPTHGAVIDLVTRRAQHAVTVFGALMGLALIAVAMRQPFDEPYLSGILMGAGVVIGGVALIFGGVFLPRLKAALRERELAFLCGEVSARAGPAVVTTRDGSIVMANGGYRELIAKSGTGGAGPLSLLHKGSEAAEQFAAKLQHLESIDGDQQPVAEINFGFGEGRMLRFSVSSIRGVEGHLLWLVNEAGSGLSQEATSGLIALAGCLDRSPVGLFTTDDAGIVQYVNDTLAAWLGSGRDELCTGNVGLEKILDGDRATVDLLCRPVEDADSPQVIGAQLKSRRGGVIKTEITRTNFHSTRDGDINLYLAFRQPEMGGSWRQLMRQATQRFERFFDHAPMGMVFIDESGKIIEGNAEFRALVSLAEGEEAGQSIISFVQDEDKAEVEARLARTGRGEAPRNVIDIRLKGVPERVIQLYASVIEETADRRRIILYLIDTTEQKSLELQFAQSQKMQGVGQLAGGVAHDFNNLLTAIIGFCDLLLMRHKAGDPSFADIMQVKQNANRAANLVRQLLAFSRQQTLRNKVLMVTDVLAEISNLLARLIGENIEFKLIHGRDIGPIKVDQGQIEQVIINLAVNARDAMPDGGTLTIRTMSVSAEQSREFGYTLLPSNDYVLIEVSDTGVGIPKADIGKIFEPFFTTKEVGEGTGLGLSTVYGIIKQTGGFIFVVSEPGKGAAFRIFLPVHHMETDESEGKTGTETTAPVGDLTGKSTILLVEDEDAVRIFAARALRNKGYTVLEASSGEAALEFVNHHDGPIHLLISDIVMPEMDGPSLVRHATERRKDMKVIFISGYTEDAFRKKIDREQISFLPKPFSLKQLALTVKEVLRD